MLGFQAKTAVPAKHRPIAANEIAQMVAGVKLHARLAGAPLLELQKSIKAVTFHNLEIRPVDAGLETTIVFDV